MQTPLSRKSVLDELSNVVRNAYCRLSDLHNEASVESFLFCVLFLILVIKIIK